VLNIENLFTSVYQARENAQIEIDLQNQKMAVESVSAAEVLIQRFACYTTTLHIFSFFYQRWDNKARRKFASDSLISTYIHHTYIHIYIHIYIYTYVHTRTLHVTLSVRAHIYMDFPLYVYSLFILPLHWPLHPSRRCSPIHSLSQPNSTIRPYVPSKQRQTEHSFDSDALCVSHLPHEHL